MKLLSILIITYNRPDDLLLLLQNIAGQQDAGRLLESVIIVNNASTTSYEAAKNYIKTQSLPFLFIDSPENLGVSRGRNKAVSLAKAPILITIDDDAYFKHPNALVQVEQLFASDYARQQNIGVYCFKVFYGNGQMQQSAFPHKQFEKYRGRERFLTSYYIGCGHAILKKVYDEAGPYPEDFFYGMEEYDLGYRILGLGYKMAYDSTVEIVHNESPLGRTPPAEKLLMMWVNKSKVAYRYLPMRYFFSMVAMWSLHTLKKSRFNLPLWFRGWGKILKIPFQEKRKPIPAPAVKYIHETEGRLWY